MSTAIKRILNSVPVIPVMVIDEICTAVPLARALLEGGLNVLEITLRTDAALAAITAIKADLPNAIVGAGTIITAKDFNAANAAGADFFVSPGISPSLKAIADPESFLPGIATPSEAMMLYEEGFRALKLFPAEALGGIALLKAIHGPLPQISFCPTGGINADKAKDYLKLPNVLCVGGSWVCPKPLLQARDWQEISRLAAEASKFGS